MVSAKVSRKAIIERAIRFHEQQIEFYEKALSMVAHTEYLNNNHPAWRTTRGRPSKYDWALGKKLWDKNTPVVTIANILGCGRKGVYAASYRYGWKKRRNVPHQLPKRKRTAP